MSFDKNAVGTVYNEGMASFIEVVTNAFDAEIVRLLTPEGTQSVISWFIERHHTTNLAAFFHIRQLTELAQVVQQDPILLQFTMDMTDHVSLLTRSDDPEGDDPVVQMVVSALARTKDRPQMHDYSLVPPNIRSELFVSSVTVKDILVNNYWLLVLYVLLAFFHQTQTYSAVKNPQS